jgi:Integrase core domain
VLLVVPPLVLGRAEIAKGGMAASAVVEHLQVLVDGGAGGLAGRPGAGVDQLGLQRREQRLGERVVEAGRHPPHALAQPGHLQRLGVDAGGVQYLSIRYTQRLADQGAVTSVGSKGDSYDNALAEAVNGLYKAELIGPRGPWRTASQVELATLAWVQWWNHRRLHGALDHIPPAEHEALYYRQLEQSKEVV